MTKPPEPVVTGELKVTQGDEDLADWFIRRMEGWKGSHDQIARLLARHRTAHALPGDVGMSSINVELLDALTALRGGIANASLVRNPHGIKLRAQADRAISRAALTPSALSGEQQWGGLLDDGMCEDHGKFMCTKCRCPVPSALSGDAGEGLPADVRRLVIAARTIAFNDWDGDSEEWTMARKELDDASEAFASRVPWETE